MSEQETKSDKSAKSKFPLAVGLGTLASFFFAFTFILNTFMGASGEGYWMWKGVLRYAFTLPIMAICAIFSGGLTPVFRAIKKDFARWFIWSTIGFGIFYLPMTLVTDLVPSWFSAAAWEFTIVAGVLLTPITNHRKIPIKNLLFSLIVLGGIVVMQIPSALGSDAIPVPTLILVAILVAIGAFAYPLGNRKMMSICPSSLSTPQRVFGMTLCAIPFWAIVGIIGFIKGGSPSSDQLISSLIVAIVSSTIATLLFFSATNMVKANAGQLAVIEATQSGEVVFTLILSYIFLSAETRPTPIAFVGIGIVVLGMILNSLLSNK